MLAVGYGEFEDSSFPSLGIGAAQSLFEDLWSEARAISDKKAFTELEKMWSPSSPFLKFAKKLHSNLDKETADTYTYKF